MFWSFFKAICEWGVGRRIVTTVKENAKHANHVLPFGPRVLEEVWAKPKEKHNEQNTAFQSNILVAATTCARNFQWIDDEEEDGAGDSDSTWFRKDGRQ